VQQSTLSAQKQSARQSIRTIERKIADLQNNLDSLCVDGADIAVLKQSMQETSTALQAAQDEFTQKAWDQKSTDLDLSIAKIEEEIKNVQMELTATSAQGEFRAKIDVLRGDLSKKSQARNVTISSTASKYKDLVGQELSATSTDSQINVLCRRRQEDLEEAERLLDGTSKEITQYEAKLNTCKEQLRDKKKEKNTAHAKVMNICQDKIEEFPDILQGYEDQVFDLKK
jgi:chromosome segregation ATPase